MLRVRGLVYSRKSEAWLRIRIRAAAVGVARVRDVNGRAPSESYVATIAISFGGVSGTLVEEGLQLSV
jgi:hypothetical protein